MKTVYKYEITAYAKSVVEMPKGASILTVEAQGRCVCIWALVDPAAEKEGRSFLIFGTGQPIPEKVAVQINYLGTAQIGMLVWHVFEDFSILKKQN